MIKGAELTRLCEAIKSCRLNISDTNGFDNAQVSAGGVSLKEVDMETMQSVLQKISILPENFLTLMEFVAAIIYSGHGLPVIWQENTRHLIYNNCFKKYK